MITTEQFVNALRLVDDKKKYTDTFENIMENGSRKYAQKKKRWWDNSSKSQKEHVICWFARKSCEPGTANECEKKYKCKNCFLNSEPKYKYLDCGYQNNAETIYNKMGRPEMYIWIISALEVLDDKQMQLCIKEIQELMDKNNQSYKVPIREIRELVSKYVTWDDLEKKYMY